MSSHRSQESDKLGEKLYFASRAAKSIKVMPSAYININGTHTQRHTHTHTHTHTVSHKHTRAGQEEKKGEMCSWARRCRFSPTVKRGKIKKKCHTGIYNILHEAETLCLLSVRRKLFIVASLRKCHYCMIAMIAES